MIALAFCIFSTLASLDVKPTSYDSLSQEFFSGKSFNHGARNLSISFDKFNQDYFENDYTKSHDFANHLLESTEKGNDKNKYIISLVYLANIEMSLHNDNQALEKLVLALKVCDEHNLKKTKGIIHIIKGDMLKVLDRVEMATTSYLNALDIFENTSEQEAGVALHKLASIEFDNHSYADAISYAKLSIEKFESIPSEKLFETTNYISAYNTIGLCLEQLQQLDSSIFYFDQSLAIAKASDEKIWQGIVIGNIASVMVKQNKPDLAIPLLIEDLKNNIQEAYWEGAVTSNLSLCEAYKKKGNFRKAKFFIDSARSILNAYPSIAGMKKYYETSTGMYKRFGDYNKALQMHEKLSALKDSIDESYLQIRLENLISRHELEKQKSEIALLTKDNQLQESSIEKRNILVTTSILIIIFTLFVLTLLTINLRQKHKDNRLLAVQKHQIIRKNESLQKHRELLEEKNHVIQKVNTDLEKQVSVRTKELASLNTELENFLYRASHDIRQPICTILGLEEVAKLQGDNPETLDILQRIHFTAKSMDGMLQKLQMAHYISVENQSTTKQNINLLASIDEALTKFEVFINKYDIALTKTIEPVKINSWSHLLDIILENLIENAIFFKKNDDYAKHHIYIEGVRNDNYYNLNIKDNGIGIDPAFHNRIFDAYFRASEKSNGTGLGLYLTKKAVSLLKGQITLESNPGAGSTFQISIPI